MGFTPRLASALDDCDRLSRSEPAMGDALEAILSRLLHAVEDDAGGELMASVLLIDDSGERLLHGAAPSLPKAYCDAIHGLAIGPNVGSCGTAAYLRHPVYVTDIAEDVLWADYAAVAAEHGLRASWSTPIEDAVGRLVGTFAIYYRTARSPTPAELQAIRLIAKRVAEAIVRSRAGRL